MFDVDVGDIGADAYVSSGHKWLQTPKGFGILHLRRALIPKVHPMIVTWGQKIWADSARRFEDIGTRDVASFLAVGDAAAFHAKLGPDAAWRQRQALIAHARQQVSASPRLAWRSPDAPSLTASLIAVETKGRTPSTIAKELFEAHGVVVRRLTRWGRSDCPLTWRTRPRRSIASSSLCPRNDQSREKSACAFPERPARPPRTPCDRSYSAARCARGRAAPKANDALRRRGPASRPASLSWTARPAERRAPSSRPSVAHRGRTSR